MPKTTDKDIVESDSLFPPTLEGKDEVEHFLAYLERCGRQALGRFERIPRNQRGTATEGMIDYWHHAISALSWARSINDRRKVRDNG